MICLLVFLVAIGSTSAVSENSKFPFCKLCNCSFDPEETYANVSCTQPIANYAFENSSWFRNKTNETYAYGSIIFQNNHFSNLSYIFPKSDLTYLNLAGNDIFRISDNVFRNLQKMAVLILSFNDLEIIHPDAFKGAYLETRLYPLRNLKELRLDHNKLHSLNQDIFEHTTDIEILDLSYNPIETIDTHTLIAIDSLAILKELYLQYTEIKTLPDNMLHTPKYLRILDLSGNTAIDKIPDTIAQGRSLEELYLNNTGFTNLTQESGFPTLEKLKVLHLCRNQHLSHIEKHSLCNLVNLEELYLSDNIDLSYIDPMALAKPTGGSGASVWPPIKKVVGIARRKNLIDDLAKKLADRKGKLHSLQADMTNEKDITVAFEWVRSNLGPVHILVNNAGMVQNTTLVGGDVEKWRKTFDVNVIGLCIATKEAIADMQKNNVNGHIIHINSIAGHQVPRVPEFNVYPASKFAVTALTESLRMELNTLKSKIKVTSISPGAVASEFMDASGLEFDEEAIEGKVMYLKPEDVANAALYVLGTPPHVQVHELTIKPVNEPF